jgi:hypothetical protein
MALVKRGMGPAQSRRIDVTPVQRSNRMMRCFQDILAGTSSCSATHQLVMVYCCFMKGIDLLVELG